MRQPIDQTEAIRHLYAGMARLKEEVDAQQIAFAKQYRPWYRDLTVVIALIAFAFSLGTTVFSYLQARQQRVHDQRTEVRAALLDYHRAVINLFQLQQQHKNDAEFVSLVSDKAGGTLSMLANRISELALDIPTEISVTEHLEIAETLHRSDQSSLAEQHIKIARQRASRPGERERAHILMATLAEGRKDFKKMRKAFTEALNAADDYDQEHLRHWRRFMISQLWSQRELANKNCTEFRAVLKVAEFEFKRLRIDLAPRATPSFRTLKSANCPT